MHRKGMEAENYLREAASELAGILKVQEKEIYFYLRRKRNPITGPWWEPPWPTGAGENRILVSAVEHAAVSAPREVAGGSGL